jgi:hypothetical protein
VKSAVGTSSDSHDAERRVGGACELIDGGAAGGEIRHHLRGHRGGIGGNAARGHAVIAGEDEDLDLVELRRRVALPVREPGDEFLEPAEAARRLGQRVFALGDGGARRQMPARQVEAERTQVGKRDKIRHRPFLPGGCWCASSKPAPAGPTARGRGRHDGEARRRD